MRFVSSLLIISYGLFTIAAQTLLFREYITTFEGNDISVGIFFGCWFLWISLGAIIIYRIMHSMPHGKAVADRLLQHIELLFLLYIPAFIIQMIMIVQARRMMGIEAYELISIKAILITSLVINAPVSFLTGMLFPIACRWFEKQQARAPSLSNGKPPRPRKMPVSRVYILEAAGSFIGGIGATILLGWGISSIRIFFIIALVLSCSAFAAQIASSIQLSKAKIKILLAAVLPVCIVTAFYYNSDRSFTRSLRITKWKRLLPAEAYKGAFHTPQAEYLYGTYRGQWIAMREGTVVDALPQATEAGREAAISLSQNPNAKRILVVGSGLAICQRLMLLPQIEQLTWAHYDSEYVEKINSFLPEKYKLSDSRISFYSGEVRSAFGGLTDRKNYFDIVILDLPEVTSSVLNRFYTREFYSQIKSSLRNDGVLAVRIPGGENIMGTELINLGASAKLTLQSVFSNLVLTPGEDTWLVVSNSEKLTGNPGLLRDRFAGIENCQELFPPDGLFSVYLPERAEYALENYAEADLPKRLLINTDSRPLANLYSLLLAAKLSGTPVTQFIKRLALAGILVLLIPVLVLIGTRLLYTLTRPRKGAISSFESSFLVFSTGLVSIAVVIVLMYSYQTKFGSLYLYIGVISSVFMAGLTLGGSLISSLLIRYRKVSVNKCLFITLLLYILVIAVIALWPDENWGHANFAAAFVLTGLCAGTYFPLASKQLTESRFDIGRTASKLETADHLGAAVGGIITSLAILPLLGTKMALFVLIVLVLANIPLVAARAYRPAGVFPLKKSVLGFQRIGYVLFGIGATIILCSNLLTAAGRSLKPALPQESAQALAGQQTIKAESATADNKSIRYFKVYEKQNILSGYIFSSTDLAGQVRGFGGKINLAIYTDPNGRLKNFHILRSNETPSYFKLLDDWLESLRGYRLFRPEAFAKIDTVTGATVSCEAVLSALKDASHNFAANVLDIPIEPAQKEAKQKAGFGFYPDRTILYLASVLIFALIVIYRGGFWSRVAVLIYTLVTGGIILNAQYSIDQIATILSFHFPAIQLSPAFLLALGVPLVVLIFGNIYCGYICPFGALQELLGFILPKRFKPSLPPAKMRYARFMKYIVLFVLILAFFFSINRKTLAADPLIAVFGLKLDTLILVIAGIALALSIFCTRFWCRYLCPVGAFLSILNTIAVLKRFLPAKKYNQCELGVTSYRQLDCIYCDKCRYEEQPIAVKKHPAETAYDKGLGAASYLTVAVVAIGIILSSITIIRFLKVIPEGGYTQPETAVTAGGQPRDVDLDRIELLIQQNKLSDKEAEYYKKIGSEGPNTLESSPEIMNYPQNKGKHD